MSVGSCVTQGETTLRLARHTATLFLERGVVFETPSDDIAQAAGVFEADGLEPFLHQGNLRGPPILQIIATIRLPFARPAKTHPLAQKKKVQAENLVSETLITYPVA